MIGKQLLLAGGLVMAAMLAPHASSAASLAPQSTLGTAQAESTLVQKAQWGYCSRWRRECADRWGWRTRDFYRCLARHGC